MANLARAVCCSMAVKPASAQISGSGRDPPGHVPDQFPVEVPPVIVRPARFPVTAQRAAGRRLRERQQAAGAQHPVGLGDGLPRIVEEVKREAAGHEVEPRVADAEPVSVHDTSCELRNLPVVSGQGDEHAGRVIDREYRTARTDVQGGRGGHRAASRGDVQHPLTGPQAAPVREPAAEGREKRNLLVVIAGEIVEELTHGRCVGHGRMLPPDRRPINRITRRASSVRAGRWCVPPAPEVTEQRVRRDPVQRRSRPAESASRQSAART
jgi:hypothetical protein